MLGCCWCGGECGLEGGGGDRCDGCKSGPSKTSKGQGGRVHNSSQPAVIDYCDASLGKKKERKKEKEGNTANMWLEKWIVGGRWGRKQAI